MERLTKWMGEHAAVVNNHANYIDYLAAYEDTGLEPDTISKIRDIVLDISGDIDHLLDLVQAEKDGRLVALPCKVGDTVYRVLTTRDCPPVLSEVKIETIGEAADLIGRFGKHKLLSYYLTREEAEAALHPNSICAATGIECSWCQPGPCDSRREATHE